LAARELAARGCGLAEIAARLGVSRASAHNYLRARDCPGCGAPMTTPGAERCRDCTRHEPSVARAWTRAEVVAAIRAWADRHGGPPRCRDWTPSRDRPGGWEAESPRWPSAAVVCALYGGWNAALRDAGVGPRLRRWDDAAVRAALGDFWAREGRPPASRDLSAWSGPSRETLRRRYGSVEAAWARLGPVPDYVRRQTASISSR
jgi:hypothetical protein